jgi:hypothetical protein
VLSDSEGDAFLQVIDALDAVGIPYMVVGSFASTFWGRPRTTHDADLVVEIQPTDAVPLSQLLSASFYAPDFAIEEAARNHDQCNVIHMATGFKVDLWVWKETPYGRESFYRRLLGVMFGKEVWVSSPEDVILSKLDWYRTSPVQDRQLQDVLEVYETQEPYLEQAYLNEWAPKLGVVDLLAQIRGKAARSSQ